MIIQSSALDLKRFEKIWKDHVVALKGQYQMRDQSKRSTENPGYALLLTG